MITATKYIYPASFFYVHFKKHFCPKCRSKVELGFDKKIVSSKSPEAKNYDFYDGADFLIGNVKFITRCFYCPNC